MEQYNVTGMSCAACQARVEKAVNAVEGVESCAVSLLTNSMGVEGTASSEAIIKAVTDAGYGASLKNAGGSTDKAPDYEDSLKDTETPKMKKRLIASLVFLLPLMYVSMGHMMWNWPLTAGFAANPLAIGIYEMLLSGIIMVINQKFFINGFKGIIHKSPNMDTLVAMGATASYGYSIYSLFAMSFSVMEGDTLRAMEFMDGFFFESAGMILTLITVGKMLEARSKGKTTDALKSLMRLAPKTAVMIDKDGSERTVPIETVKVNDCFVVRPGEYVPVDGVVTEGSSAVNESALTGESVPVEKSSGSPVYAATLNTSGYIKCEATRVGEDTSLSGIIRMVSDAAATKAPIAKVADRVSGVFVPTVITISLITLIVWLLVGQTFGYAIARAVSVLVISCPCALGLATPVAIMVGNGVGAKSGILFKTAVSLEQTGKVKIIALDKTGTITTGEMKVMEVIPAEGTAREELLNVAMALEAKSEHPISKAITSYAGGTALKPAETDGFEILPGNGLKAVLEGKNVYGGNSEYLLSLGIFIPQAAEDTIKSLSSKGGTPVLFAKEDKLLGIIAVSDTMKEDSAEAVKQLKDLGIHVVMLTGDNETVAKEIADRAGVDEFAAGLKPDGKEAVVRELKKHGNVAMVGDGINDAPALTSADMGIAVGAGTDVAIDAADVVIMKNSLMDVAAAVRISRATLKNIHENLFWAFFYNIIGIPLAAGCYVSLFGWSLNPMFGALAMSLSSFCVVSNALRLNTLKPYDHRKDKAVKNPVTGVCIDKTKKEEKREEKENMKISVKGMMCPHCEAHVKEALEKIDGVTEAKASHTENLVTLTTSRDIDEAALKAAVEGAGYEYAGVIG